MLWKKEIQYRDGICPDLLTEKPAEPFSETLLAYKWKWAPSHPCVVSFAKRALCIRRPHRINASSHSLWEKHEWQHILFWHIINSSSCRYAQPWESAVLPRLRDVCLWFGSKVMCPAPLVSARSFHSNLFSASHKYQRGRIFLVQVCGIVRARF